MMLQYEIFFTQHFIDYLENYILLLVYRHEMIRICFLFQLEGS
jgi:hypothetical protein